MGEKSSRRHSLKPFIDTMDHPLANIVFIISLTLCVWNFLRAMQLDPGSVPRPSSQSEIKQHIEELVSEGRLNGQNFCIYTLVSISVLMVEIPTNAPLSARSHCVVNTTESQTSSSPDSTTTAHGCGTLSAATTTGNLFASS